MLPSLGHGPVYFLAEAPGADEDQRTHKPLTGPTGQLLRSLIPDGYEQLCTYDNVCNCRPPQNRTPTWQEIECCRPRRVKWIEEVKPKLIVGLGGTPLQWALGSTDVAGMRGRFFAIKVGGHHCWFMPTYHPSFILRIAPNKKKPLNSRLGHCLRMDIKRAFDAASQLDVPHVDTESEVRANVPIFDGSGPDDFRRVCEILDNACRSPVSIDIETQGLRPYSPGANILSVGLAFEGITAAFAFNHPKGAFSDRQKQRISQKLCCLLRHSTVKIAHNAPFELEWFINEFGPDIVRHDSWECTQMQAHFLDERRGKRGSDDDHRAPYQNLNFLCKQHFGIAFKPLFKLNKKDMSKSPLGEMLIYNGVDAKYTLRLWKRQNKLLQQQGLYDAYIEALPRQPAVALMQHIGVGVDQREVLRAQAQLNGEITSIESEIHSLPVVKAFKSDKGNFNPQSGPDAVSIFKDYLGRTEIEVEGKYTTNKNVLEQIDHPLAKLIVRLRNRVKMKSTYVDDLVTGKGKLIFPDGKLHTNFNSTFTETGRFSSDEPNLQNFPKRNDNWVRRQIIAPNDYWMVAVDYGQLEACTGAMCSKDERLVNMLWNDYDIHYDWAFKMAERMPALVGGKEGLKDKALMRKFRSLIKNKLTFPAFYGAANESVCGYLIAATGLEIEQTLVDDIMSQFWGTFAGVAEWQDTTMKRYYDIGYVETLCGRRHYYPLSRNEALNMPFQGTAAELVCDAMVRLSEQAAKTGKWYLHPVLNIHDDLTFFVPKREPQFTDAIDTISRAMLTFDYDWINVPLSVEISVGPNWADLKPLDKLWSHKNL